MSLLQNSNAISSGGYNLESSLRFRSSASAYLNRTPTTAGNRKTWTWSAWIKKSSIMSSSGTDQSLFHAYSGSGTTRQTGIFFTTYSTIIDSIRIESGTQGVSQDFDWGFSNTYRDPSSWYHIVVAFDTANATASERCKVYVNNNELTSKISYAGRATTISQNYETAINDSIQHTIGGQTSGLYLDGYMTEVNFVDGQALTPSDFGETDDTTGVWKPKEYTGTYGTNGFYLPMKETQQATGFNTVLYTGTGATQSISNVGFAPDLVWVKSRNNAYNHVLVDSVRGASKELFSDGDYAEQTAGDITSFDSNGFTLGNLTRSNGAGTTQVAWCWDAGSSTVSNTDGSITSSVRANPATGFSVVTWTGNGTGGATVGHGLGTAPSMIIVKDRSLVRNWLVYHSAMGATKGTELNLTNGFATYAQYWNNTAPTSSVFSTGTWSNENASNYVTYCFSEVAGYSKFGSYTGNGSTSGPTITTGFRPAFVLIKNTTTTQDWLIYDDARTPNNTRNKFLKPNSSDAEVTASTSVIDFTDTGFEIKGSSVAINENGSNHIYMAFADTRDAQFNFDASGNNNNWTPNNINSNGSSESTYDIMNDVPTLTDEDTGNFATLNPIATNTVGVGTLSNANLNFSIPNTYTVIGNISSSEGKYYWEVVGTTNALGVGIKQVNVLDRYSNAIYYTGAQLASGQKYVNGTGSAYGATWSAGDVIGVAVDMDAGNVTFYKNNVSQGAIALSLASITEFVPSMVSGAGQTFAGYINFGQRPFKYTPPTGYKKLNTYNLPDSTIKDGSQYMNSVTYTGNGSTQSITGVGFSPDLVWIKQRSTGTTQNHTVWDTVRGVAGGFLMTNSTNATGYDGNGLSSFDSDGWSMGLSAGLNESGKSFVGWLWRGSDSSAVSNTDGTITSTVSANTDSGFSIISFTGNATLGATIGHGLGIQPKMVIVKNRDLARQWFVYHNALGATKYLRLEGTDAQLTSTSAWNNTNPTSSVITLGNFDHVNGSGNNMIAYAFADVEGFSKFGSYTGNGSADGTFIYTGFRPAFVMVKRTDTTGNWRLVDTTRGTFNATQYELYPNLTNAEGTATYDILSNGFKNRETSADYNASGGTYIYMAFASNPLKHSLAR